METWNKTNRGSSNIAYFATLNHIIERTHNLLHRCIAIQSVKLKNIDVRSEALDARINSIKDMLPAQAALVYSLPIIDGKPQIERSSLLVNCVETLAHNHDLGAGNGVLFHELCKDLFRAAVGVRVGDIPSVDAEVVGTLDERERLFD